MKKITRAVAIVLLFALTIPILASCGNIASCGNMNGNKAIKKFDELIAESDKFYADGKYTESTISLEMSGTLSEVSISSKSESTGTITAINKGTESFSYLEKAQFTNSSKIGDSEETVEKFDMLKGYVDKNMIYSYVPTKKSKKVQLKSSCTPSEYEQYLDFQKGINTPQIKSEYIEEITIKEETSDNVWIITITELNKNGENAFDDWFHYSMANTSLYFKLKRFEAIITVDIDTGAIKESKMNIKAQSSVQDVEMSIKSNEKYFLPDPNENLIPENYDKYVETGNLMYSSYALHEIRKLLTLNNDTSFSFAGSTWIKSGTNLNVSENYSVNLGIKNKNFVYQIDGETRSGGKSSEMTVTYDGKNQKISLGGKDPQSNEQSEYEAKSYIVNSMLNSFYFDEQYIKSIKVVPTINAYNVTFTLNNSSKLTSLLTSAGLSADNLTNSDIYLKIVFEKETNKIISAEYKASGTINSANIYYQANISNFDQPDLSFIEEN